MAEAFGWRRSGVYIRQRAVRDFKGEDGSALILVLAVVVLLSLLVLSALSMSQTASKLSRASRDRIAGEYHAEGGADMAIWLLSEDIRLHHDRSILSLDGDETIDGTRRFMADGRRVGLPASGDFEITCRIFDAASGIDVGGGSPQRNFAVYAHKSLTDPDITEELRTFSSRLSDYVDSNPFVRPEGGMEDAEYAERGMSPLPRNAPMLYREEVLWIPGSERFVHVDSNGMLFSARVIPPSGMPRVRGKTSFFTADSEHLALWGRLSSDELESVLAARSAWFSDGTPLKESIPSGVLGKLGRQFSFKESGLYTFLVEAREADTGVKRVYSCTLRVYSGLAGSGGLRYYDWRFLQ